MNTKVSVIMPCYNAEHFISEAIRSVIAQSYSNWELLVIDDCSTDSSCSIITDFCKTDSRIKYFKTNTPSGSPALPRNIGIQNASGRYIAFLDSDDIWFPTKLEKQIPFFSGENVAVVFSDYEKISESGRKNNRYVFAPGDVNYFNQLESCYIGFLTAVYDSQKVGKVYFREIDHEDFVFWLDLLGNKFIGKNCGEILASYRIVKKSVSNNKVRSALWQWNIYRNVLRMPLHQCFFFFIIYACMGVKRKFTLPRRKPINRSIP
ncbi:MAG: glycosyltransferase family 2 protein [Spirochaetes bacterium]|uniref:Glycosyltransferase family 2 protein n=1 Tax=Candidatus Gallitreponema excrementavium TaxID=2840840 RepID=A0A9D9HMU0_9SPIR|nr:glycosyltransferase family 2 protein [Candidatus Gallitreponema excrementavium]